AMGHDVPTMIGVEQRDIARKINRLVPEYMVMGDRGMADMGEMEMALPDNTLPMMTGFGPYGPLEMGGMFTVVKIRRDIARNDYRDPGWYAQPEGSMTYELTDAGPAVSRAPGPPAAHQSRNTTTMTVRKPASHGGH
ncbi:MAG: copper oxidase, partial [Burkholderiales bacterium]